MARNNTKWEISINFVPFESTEIRDKSYELWANSFNHFQKRNPAQNRTPQKLNSLKVTIISKEEDPL